MSGRLLATLLVVLLSAILAPLGASAATAYTYDGQKYASAREALAAHQRDLDRQIAAVPQAAAPVPGRALIVLPDRDRLRPLVAGLFKAAPSEDLIAYGIEYTHQTLSAVANAATDARLFTEVQVVERNDTVAPALRISHWPAQGPLKSGLAERT
jgi:hypothetical protein